MNIFCETGNVKSGKIYNFGLREVSIVFLFFFMIVHFFVVPSI